MLGGEVVLGEINLTKGLSLSGTKKIYQSCVCPTPGDTRLVFLTDQKMDNYSDFVNILLHRYDYGGPGNNMTLIAGEYWPSGNTRYAVTGLFTETTNDITAIKLSYKDSATTVNKVVINSNIENEPVDWTYQQTEIDYGSTTKNLVMNIVNIPSAVTTVPSKIVFLSNAQINTFSELTAYLETRSDADNPYPTIDCCGGEYATGTSSRLNRYSIIDIFKLNNALWLTYKDTVATGDSILIVHYADPPTDWSYQNIIIA